MGDLTSLVVGLLAQAVVLGAGGMWKLTRVEVSIRNALARNRQETDNKINTEIGQLRADLRDDHDEFEKQWGDGLLALRGKINEVELDVARKVSGIELWNRDNFVRRDDFGSIVSGLSRSVDGLRTEISARLERIEDRMPTKASP